MYTYQCSKQECSSKWSLSEGNLNGFVLTCPVCGKGRGVFVSQSKNDAQRLKDSSIEEIMISIDSTTGKTSEDINQAIEDYRVKNSLSIVSKNFETKGNEIKCYIQYKVNY